MQHDRDRHARRTRSGDSPGDSARTCASTARPVFHGPCTTVVIATGQFRRGLDLVPRGHPGDGRAEVQVYAVPGRERRRLRGPPGHRHPRPAPRDHPAHRAPSVTVSVDRRVPLEIDGRPVAGADLVEITRRPERLPPPPLTCENSEFLPPVGLRTRSGRDARWSTEASLPSPVPCSTRRRRSPTGEADRLRPYFTNLDGPVFALTNLPEVVKGALFARYSRSDKSLRRLFLDEFVGDLDLTGDLTVDATVGLKRAEELYERVFLEYGDDSVAQLGGVHLACEQASNLLTKILEWGRLMAYLEQSTRYIPYDSRLQGRYRYLRPSAGVRVAARHPLRRRPRRALRHVQRGAARDDGLGPRAVPEGADRLRLRLQADDQGQGVRHAARPAARRDALERRHLRHRPGLRGAAPAHARPPAPRGADVRPADARRAPQGHPVVPRARRPARARRRVVGVPRRDARRHARARPAPLRRRAARSRPPRSTSSTGIPTARTRCSPRSATRTRACPRRSCSSGCAGCRPTIASRSCTRTSASARTAATSPAARSSAPAYRFDVLGDYGAFRDLQRHRMLTIEWQQLTPHHGYEMPEPVRDAGLDATLRRGDGTIGRSCTPRSSSRSRNRPRTRSRSATACAT